MAESISSKRLTLRAVLRDVNPMVIRIVEISDHFRLPEFHDIFRTILGWDGDLGYIIRIHWQEFNSFRRNTRSKALHEFQLHRQEKFLYICGTLHLWQWDVRVLDIQEGVKGESAACPLPEWARCGAARKLWWPHWLSIDVKRQRNEATLCDPALQEVGIQILAESCPDEPVGTWDLLRTVLLEGLESIDRRLKEAGPIQPERFELVETNERLAALQQHGRFQR